MDYKFLKRDFETALKEKQIDNPFFQKFNIEPENQFIINHNIDTVYDVLDFLSDKNKIFIINGFMGSGKSQILDFVKNTLEENVLIFKTNYFDSTNLDDVLLSFFNSFNYYHSEKKLILPKVETTIFTEKIHSFIKVANAPMLFIFDSLEFLKMNSSDQKDIMDFIKYLSNFDKIKIIIASRSFDEDYLDPATGAKSSMLRLVDKETFTSLLESNRLNDNPFHIEEVFKYTKGHYLYVSLFINLVKLLNITFPALLNEFGKRNTSFSDFLIVKILGLIPDKFLKTLCFLGLIRHGVSEKFIVSQNLSSKEELEYLSARKVICEESGLIYIKDYIKNVLLTTIDSEVKSKIHNYMKDLYESQLPKKPFERDLSISRATMRKEIDYHREKSKENTTLSSSQSKSSNTNAELNFLSYSKGVSYEWSFKNSPLGADIAPKPSAKNGETPKNGKENLFELSKEELALLNSSDSAEETIAKNMVREIEPVKKEPEKKEFAKEDFSNIPKYKETFEDWIHIAQKAEEQFDYNSAILSYQKALALKEDPLFDVKKPLLMTKLAICYKKLQQTDKAVQQFEAVYNVYKNSEPVKANYILLSIAQIYNETYKFSMAKSVYEKILNSSAQNPPALLVRVLLDLSDIEDNNTDFNKASEYCRKALQEAEKIEDLKLLSEACFKYALLMDDAGKLDTAVQFYQKCINVSEDPVVNSCLSSAYSNLASIYAEQNNRSYAVKYYNLSIEADKSQNNFEGLYFGYSKLAHIYQSESPQKALEFLVNALKAARRLDDTFYAASAYLDLGDFYYARKNDSKALKAYFMARNLILKQPNKENLERVSVRINDIKVRIGNNKFIQLMSEFQKR